MISDVIHTGVTGVTAHAGGIENEEMLTEILQPFEKLFLRPGEIPYSEKLTAEQLTQALEARAYEVYDAREKEFGLMPDGKTPVMRELERVILLRVVDEYWMDHIDAMAELRRGIGLRGYAQVKPIDEYKREGSEMFEAMVNGIKDEVVRRVLTAEIRKPEQLERKETNRQMAMNAGGDDSVKKQPLRVKNKIGRNEPCPCGSGKKYKYCHGRDA